MSALGRRLRQLREMRGLSQEQVAVEIGSTQNYLSLIENGKREPSLKILNALSRALGCAVADLFRDASPEPLPLFREAVLTSSPVLDDAPSIPTARMELETARSSIEATYRAVESRGERILARNTLRRLHRMATLYEVHYTLKEYFEERQPWPRIARIISKDRVLAVKIWEAGKERALARGKALEGPGKNRPPETGHVETALRFLGEGGIRKAVLHATEQELKGLMAEISLGCPDYDRSFWCHGALTAHAMLRLLDAHPVLSGAKSTDLDVPTPGVVFRMGLLLDVGMLFMHLEDPQSTQDVWVECTRTPRYMAYPRGEWHLYQRYLHALKGAQVMRLARWTDLEINVTEYHHDPAAIGESHPHLTVIQCAHLADIIASLIVSAPALTIDDLDVDPPSFDTVLGRKDAPFIRGLVEDVVTTAQKDGFNLSWSWPAYRELLKMMVPSAARGGHSEWRRREDYPQPFSWWLAQNERRVGGILTGYQQRRKLMERQ